MQRESSITATAVADWIIAEYHENGAAAACAAMKRAHKKFGTDLFVAACSLMYQERMKESGLQKPDEAIARALGWLRTPQRAGRANV